MVRRERTMTLFGVLLAASMTLSRSTPAAKDEKRGPPGNHPAAASAAARAGEHSAAPGAKGKGHAHSEPRHEPEAPGRAHEPHGSKGPHGDGKGDPAGAAGGAPRAQRAEFKSALAGLRERQAQGKLSKEELKKELAALDKSRSERRRQHREVLKERWGGELARPPAREELRHHERRMAQLERMALLAQTERSGAAKDQLATRIDKLIARENERHQRKMTQLAAQAGTTQPASVREQNPAAKRAGDDRPAGDKAAADKAAADKGATP